MWFLVVGFVNYVLFSPILLTFLAVVFSVSSLGKAIGIRRLYVNFLLRIFEYGRVNIEKAKAHSSDDEEEDDSLVESQFKLGADEEKDDSQPEKSSTVTTITSSSTTTTNGNVLHVPSEQMNGKSNGTETNGGIVRNGSAAAGNGLQRTLSSVISKNAIKLAPDMSEDHQHQTKEKGPATAENFDFRLENCLDYMNAGMEAIIEDDVTSRFEAEEIKSWNLLTRTNRRYEFITWRLTVIWVIGFFIRYFILMPFRVFICFCGVLYLTLCTALVGCWPDDQWKPRLVQRVLIHCFGVLSSALSPVVTYHNEENKPKKGICVANHTSPIDALVLMCDNCYSLIGQRHGGFLGVLQKALSRASPHIWFERAEAKDRHAVAQRLKDHVSNPKNPPILIFPEGTCINNTSVMQFKKGSFEVGGVIYPVAIKYDARFGDAFWNSAKYSMMQHLFLMMTSWAIVCDVWYLPPMYQQEGESAIAFANRVKSVIAKQGGLVDLIWDGQLKRQKARKEWKEQQQEEFTKRLKAGE